MMYKLITTQNYETKLYPLLLVIVGIVLFSNCESNTEDIIPDPIIETPI